MKYNILTLFPEMFTALNESILKRAKEEGLIDINILNIRDFSHNKHNHVDDTPYGGGAGMVIKPDVLKRTLDNVEKDTHVIYLSPKGKMFNNEMAKELSKKENITFIAGHYEGIDERFIQKYVDEEISIGDYILSGGEIPCMVLIDAISRHITGVISDESLKEESFENGFLEYSQYTKPEIFEDMKVPEVLLSGHHKKIEEFRRKESIKITFERRKDLLEKAIKENKLTKEDLEYIEKLKKSRNN